MKVVTVVGARPQFVKAAAVSAALAATSDVEECLVHTGQHYDHGMSEVFFEELGIPQPAHNLGIGGGTHGAMTGKMLEALEQVFLVEKPDWVLVYGDTNSTLAAALAAAKLLIPIAHVEAGLRSFNKQMPEEINRILTDHASTLLLTPTAKATQQLIKEGVAAEMIREVGDVMYDVALKSRLRAGERSTVLQKLSLEPKHYALMTVHRQENTDDPSRLKGIIDGVHQVSQKLPIVLPLHPRTRAALDRQGLLESVCNNFCVIDPVGYLDMVALLSNASLVLTDSGGVQKEAYFFHVPCVTLRDQTEWTELLEGGYNRLVGADSEQISRGAAEALATDLAWEQQLYGSGDASDKVVAALREGM